MAKNYNKYKRSGWFKESQRHSLAAKGVKTGSKFKVTAMAYDRYTKKPIGKQRAEIVDVNNNVLFSGKHTDKEVKAGYESYWNDLNPKSVEVVKVKDVKVLAAKGKHSYMMTAKQKNAALNKIAVDLEISAKEAKKVKYFPVVEGGYEGVTFEFPANKSMPLNDKSYNSTEKNPRVHVATVIYKSPIKSGLRTFIFKEDKKYIKREK